ncbi:hypothetical protein [Tabrizicola soli]|nr:hypothetical protein [Tabrizicola soli]
MALNALMINEKTPFFSQETNGPVCSAPTGHSAPAEDVFRIPSLGPKRGLIEPQQRVDEVAARLPMGGS